MNIKTYKIVRNTLFAFTGIIVLFFLSLTGFILLVANGAFGPLPKREALKSITNEEASLVFSSDKKLIGKYFAENRTNIKWDEIPSHTIQALIATEDKRYYEHEGYDTRSYVRVLLRTIMLRDRSGGGGSTITQQLIKNLYGRNNHGIFTFPVNKVKEAIIASRIEHQYSKNEILLLYLNSVPFGEEVFGIESAANRYFNKPASELKAEESAVLIGMLKANTYYNPRIYPENAIKRRNTVLQLMAAESYLEQQEADSLKALPLELNYENIDQRAPAAYFVYQVRKKAEELLLQTNKEDGTGYDIEKDGLRIYTTLHYGMHELATQAARSHLSGMQKLLDKELEQRQARRTWQNKAIKDSLIGENDLLKKATEVFDFDSIYTAQMSKADSLWHYYKMLHAAVLITEAQSGRVLSWVGGNNFQHLPFDMVLSHRQIASAFKPVLYATALEEGLTPCTYLNNEVNIYEEYEDWEPQNFDLSSTPDSSIALWYALVHSMNLPSVDLYFRTGHHPLVSMCNRLGFPPVVTEAPSLALGTIDLSLYEVARAYGAFANQGQLSPLVMIDKITTSGGEIIYQHQAKSPQQAMQAETSATITAILQKAIDEGTGTAIRTRYGIKAELAGKTGTSQNNSNAWFVAYTPQLVIASWVGARSPEMHFMSNAGTGSALALPIAGRIVSEIEKNSTLRKQYLTSFSQSENPAAELDCPPYRTKGMKGLFDRLFNNEEKEDEDKEEKKVKNFFNKLFKKGKR
ncbi:transglycosylase domain-containing protein [Roseimarinus sediminis]|uniref:transglycosylase domain-containing protein n=1 Tax=Roseimarinus sediminis TaxID=1610899 RepID=UPI003D1B90C7